MTYTENASNPMTSTEQSGIAQIHTAWIDYEFNSAELEPQIDPDLDLWDEGIRFFEIVDRSTSSVQKRRRYRALAIGYEDERAAMNAISDYIKKNYGIEFDSYRVLDMKFQVVPVATVAD